MINLDIHAVKPLRELIYDELKNRILTGKLEPGIRLMENTLADELGVSRTPVREAIRKLEKEHLVTIAPRRGAYVAERNAKVMIDILEVRESMEGLTAYYCAQRISDDQKTLLRDYADCFRKAVEEGNCADMIKYDTEFHHLIIECSSNPILIRMIEHLRELLLQFRTIYFRDSERNEILPSEHYEILEAIEAGDAKRASDAAASHIVHLKELAGVENSES